MQYISEDEVVAALKAMKPRKSPGPTGLTSDIIKAAGHTAIVVLTKIFNGIYSSEKMPDDFHRSYTISIYKGKGDPLNCASYRGIRLLEHCMKTYETVLELRLRNMIHIDDLQYGFMRNKSTTDPIFIFRQLQEKYAEKKTPLYHIFVHLEKAFDRIPRQTFVWALRRQLIPEKLIRLVMLTYESTKTIVKTQVGLCSEIDINVGVHQGSVLSPLLFICVMQEATKTLYDHSPLQLLYADDLVLTAPNINELIEKFTSWRNSMAKCGMKVNTCKTKYMGSGVENPVKQKGKYPCSVCSSGVGANSILCESCNKWCHKRCSGIKGNIVASHCFKCPKCSSDNPQNTTGDRNDLTIADMVIEQVSSFPYLGDVVQVDGAADAAIRSRVHSTWNKWKVIGGLLVDRNIPLKSRKQLYMTSVRPVMLYGSETWPVKRTLVSILQRTEIR